MAKGEAAARISRFMRPGTSSAGGPGEVEAGGWGSGASEMEGAWVEAAETARLARRISLSWRALPELEDFLRMVRLFATDLSQKRKRELGTLTRPDAAATPGVLVAA